MTNDVNFTRLSRAVALLGDTLRPFVERELKRAGGNWWTTYVLPHVSPLTRQTLPAIPQRGLASQLGALDVADLLQLITGNWHVFRTRLPEPALSWSHELRAYRNLWAHKGAGDIDSRQVDRAIDTAALLLDKVDSSASAAMRLFKEPELSSWPPAIEVPVRSKADVLPTVVDGTSKTPAITPGRLRHEPGTLARRQARTLMDRPFEYSGSLAEGLVIYFRPKTATGYQNRLTISRDTIDIIRGEIATRTPVLMGANRQPLVRNSVGETLSIQYRKSPQNMSYVLPLLIEEGFCTVSDSRPFIITKTDS